MHEARKIGENLVKCSDPTQRRCVHSMLVRDCAEKNQISITSQNSRKKFEGAIRTFQKRNLQTFYNFGECFLIVVDPGHINF